jgi:hypothetical protein
MLDMVAAYVIPAFSAFHPALSTRSVDVLTSCLAVEAFLAHAADTVRWSVIGCCPLCRRLHCSATRVCVQRGDEDEEVISHWQRDETLGIAARGVLLRMVMAGLLHVSMQACVPYIGSLDASLKFVRVVRALVLHALHLYRRGTITGEEAAIRRSEGPYHACHGSVGVARCR